MSDTPKLDDFMREIECYDMKWYEEIGGHQAAAELTKLRQKAEMDGKEIAKAHNVLTDVGISEGTLPERISLLRDTILAMQPDPRYVIEIEKAKQLRSDLAELKSEFHEQLCEKCRMIYPSEECKKEGSNFLWCPNCHNPVTPLAIAEKQKLRSDLAEAIRVTSLAHKTLADIPIGVTQIPDVGHSLSQLSAFLERMKETK
jgi:hypothetical protein